MQKKISCISLALVLVNSLHVNAQDTKPDSSQKKWFMDTRFTWISIWATSLSFLKIDSSLTRYRNQLLAHKNECSRFF